MSYLSFYICNLPIRYDLMVECNAIGLGRKVPKKLLGDFPIAPVKKENAYPPLTPTHSRACTRARTDAHIRTNVPSRTTNACIRMSVRTHLHAQAQLDSRSTRHTIACMHANARIQTHARMHVRMHAFTPAHIRYNVQLGDLKLAGEGVSMLVQRYARAPECPSLCTGSTLTAPMAVYELLHGPSARAFGTGRRH